MASTQQKSPTVTTNGHGLDALRAGFHGQLIEPGGEGYEQRRRVWNAQIDRKPALIARCAGVADVIAAVNYARDHKMLLAVRGGGHNIGGLGTCDGGVLVDLSPMKGMRVDAKARTAWAQGGVIWGELDRETAVHGLATPGGTVSDTGIGGLTLGGGLGWLMNLYGTTCDNLLSADVVTADGKAVRASATENPDLFWALRGGGGNFGVVTGFEYRLHPVSTALAGMLLHPISKAREALRFYRDFLADCPDELSVHAGMLSLPDGTPVVAFIVGYFGDQARGEKLIAPLRKFGPPIADTIAVVPYVALQRALEAGLPPGIGRYWKSGYTKSLSDGFLDTLLASTLPLPNPMSIVLLFHFHGVAARVKPDATAYSHRTPLWDWDIISQWTDPADAQKLTKWVRDAFNKVAPHGAADVYMNHLAADDGDRVKAAYGSNYDRLAQVKAKYDPHNLFRVNHNIKPATGK